MAKAFKLYPPATVEKATRSFYDTVAAEITKNVRECLTATGKTFTVKGEDASVSFTTQQAAVDFIVKATLMPYLETITRNHAKMKAALAAKQPFVPDESDNDMLLSHSGVSTPLHDGTMADDTDPFGTQKPRTLMERHRQSMAKRGRVNKTGREARIQ